MFTLEHEKICKHCVNKFDNENDVREHISRTHGEKLYKCDHCEQAFQWEDMVKKPNAEHAQRKKHKTNNYRNKQMYN